MSDLDFGTLLRQRRERLGLTPSRVAELIGRAPGTVRAWEKGTSVPTDAAVVSTLAAVLGIDEITLFGAAGLELPVSERSPSVRQALSTITPAARMAAADSDDDAANPPQPSPPPIAARVEGSDRPAMSPAPTSGRRIRPPEPSVVGAGEAGEAPLQTPAPSQTPARQPRHRSDGVLERLRKATVRNPAPAPVPTTLPPAPREPSYLEDPNERWSYRLRSLYTAAGVVALFVALGWAAANLFDALGDLWEILTANL